MRWRSSLGWLLLACLACEDPLPEVDAGVEDAGVEDAAKPPEDLGTALTTRLDEIQLHPSTEEASSASSVLRGRLGAHAVQTATNAQYRLRGGFRPLTP